MQYIITNIKPTFSMKLHNKILSFIERASLFRLTRIYLYICMHRLAIYKMIIDPQYICMDLGAKVGGSPGPQQ